jgi:hypothetical protein
MLINCTCEKCGHKYIGLVLSSHRLFLIELMLAIKKVLRGFPVPSLEEIILHDTDPVNLPADEIKYTICLHCRAENHVSGRDKILPNPSSVTTNYAQGRLDYMSSKGITK